MRLEPMDHEKASSARCGEETFRMNRRDELNRHLTIIAFAAPGAAIVWFVFHTVYGNLTASEHVVGYVDPLTQMGIFLGYCAMIGGTLLFGGIAAWSALQYVRLLLRREP